MSKPFQGDLLLLSHMTACHEKSQIFAFQCPKMNNTNEKTPKKQFELLHNALDVKTAELVDAEYSFHQENSAVRMRRCNQAKFGCSVSLHR